MHTTSIARFVGLCALWLVASAAYSADSGPIRVGLTTSLTGSLAEFGVSQKRGVEFWAADVNDRGQLLGRPVEIVLYDDASTEENATRLYEKLVTEDRVDLLISPYASSLTLAAAAVAERHGVPMVSVASSTEIWSRGYKNVFGLYTPAAANMDPVLALAKERHLATVALIYLDDEFPRDVANGVRAKASLNGLRIVLDEKYGSDLTAMPALARRVAAANADVVIVGSYLDDAIAFAKAAIGAGVKPKVFAFSGAPAVREFVDALGERNAHGMLSTVQWTRGIRLPGSFDLSYRYEQRYGEYPNYDVAGGYAAGQVLEAAVRLAGTVDRAAVRNELAALKVRTILGNYRVDPTGLQTAKSTYLLQCQDDHLSLVYPPEVARFPLVYPYSG